MPRIACLRIPAFQIAVHQRHEPQLKASPFALLSGNLTAAGSSRVKVLMCSGQAARKSVSAGMRLPEARAACADLVWREPDPPLYLEAQRQLIRTLIACSPRVTAEDTGMFLLDASGLRYLGGESKFCRNVLKLCSKSGFVEGRVGVADSAFAAMVATAFKHRRWCLVPAGGDADFLAPLSIRFLPVSADMQEALLALGVTTMGGLAELAPQSLAERFGAEGLRAHHLSRGLDDRRPRLPELEREFQCSADMGGPMETLNETLFVLKSMLDRLMAQLTQDGLQAEELVLAFYNDNDMFHERPVRLLRPSNHTRFLLDVLRLSLEAQPLTRQFTGLRLAVSRFSRESWEQLQVNERQPDAHLPEPLLLLLQKFTTRLGEEAVVRPVANDQHFPDAAGIWVPVLQPPEARSVLPTRRDFTRDYSLFCDTSQSLVLRQYHAPVPAITGQDGSPAAINYRGVWHRVTACTMPERLSGLWWEEPVQKSYYVALIEPQNSVGGGTAAPGGQCPPLRSLGNTGGINAAPTADFKIAQGHDRTLTHNRQHSPASGESLVLIACDHKQDSWYLEGFFD